MTEDAGGAQEEARTADDEARRGPRARVGEGIKEGLGVLSALKDALEETIQEARERGDLSADKAREVVRDAMDRAQAARGRARDRLDFATQGDLEGVRHALDALAERVGALEEEVFGARRETPQEDPAGDDARGAEAPESDVSGDGAGA